MKYLNNAFSLNMLDGQPVTIDVLPLDLGQARSEAATAQSIVGHVDTATLLDKALGRPVEVNRVTIQLKAGDVVIVGQYRGPRLEPGTKTLPEGASIEFFKVSISRPAWVS